MRDVSNGLSIYGNGGGAARLAKPGSSLSQSQGGGRRIKRAKVPTLVAIIAFGCLFVSRAALLTTRPNITCSRRVVLTAALNFVAVGTMTILTILYEVTYV